MCTKSSYADMHISTNRLCNIINVSADQVDNAAMVEELGIAKRIGKHQLSNTNIILEALQSVITESRYRQKARKMSSMWHQWQELVSPKETFAFWIGMSKL